MKTELEREDIEAIAREVAALLKPLLNSNVIAHAKESIFDVSGLAEYLKVDDSWVYKQVSLKAIPYFKSGKYTRFRQSAIDKWIENNMVNPIPPTLSSKRRTR